MMRKNNNNRNNNMKHRGGNNGGRRYQNNGGGNNRGVHDAGNIQRQKHHATQQLGKYSDLARNAQINGDRVDVEYYLQHVDHYTRVLTDIAAIEAERYAHQRESQIIPGGPNDPNAEQVQHSSSQAEQASEGGEANAAPEAASAGDEAAAHAPQPHVRAQRPPRRQHYSEPRDNGAAEANSNQAEIPLPSGILPPIEG